MAEVIVSGKHRVDIDAEACGVALCELYRYQGRDVFLFLSPVKQGSLTEEVKSWPYDAKTKDLDASDKLIVVDCSDTTYLEQGCGYNLDYVVEIIDHHFGSEVFWHDKIGRKAVIEPVGAAATLVWEMVQNAGVKEVLSDTAMKLLYTAIVSNTLNFKAQITHERDHVAAQELWAIIQHKDLLPNNRIEIYFQDIADELYQNPEQTLREDCKDRVSVGPHTFAIGQLEVWEGREFLDDYQDLVLQVMESYDQPMWFFTLASIAEGVTYVLCNQKQLQNALIKIGQLELLAKQEEVGIYVADQLRMRKEWCRELHKFWSSI